MTDEQRAIGRMEGKLDLILDRMDRVDRTAEKLDERLDAVEAKVNGWHNKVIGAGAVIGIIFGLIGSKLAKYIPL